MQPSKKPVITGGVSVDKKKSNIVKNASLDVKDFIVEDIVIPTVKRTISDIVNNIMTAIADAISGGTDVALFGENIRSRSNGGKRNYNRMSSNNGTTIITNNGPGSINKAELSRRNHDFSAITIASREDAEVALDYLDGLIADYGRATVADFYDTLQISTTYMDRQFGWHTLKSASIQRRSGGGYYVDLPKPIKVV